MEERRPDDGGRRRGARPTEAQLVDASSQCTALPKEALTSDILESMYPTRSKDSLPASLRKTTSSSPDGRLAMSSSPASRGKKLQRMGAQQRLVMFRQMILEKFSTMKTAFETYVQDGHHGELNRKGFSRFLSRHFTDLPREDMDKIFDFLDVDKSGTVSIAEFHGAVEAASPVRTLEDLRRKWIALGFPSMHQVIMKLSDRPSWRSARMTLADFGEALAAVGITSEEETQYIFNAVSNPTKSDTVAIEELTSALCAVSPSLFLEESRDRLLNKYGSLCNAWDKLDTYNEEEIDMNAFLVSMHHHMGMSLHEAKKLFRLIDIDRSLHIDRNEFVGALRLSEPSLFLEDLRRKVRQRYRSIREVLSRKEESCDPDEDDADAACAVAAAAKEADRTVRPNALLLGLQQKLEAKVLTAQEFQTKLEVVQLTAEEAKLLFEIVNIDGDDKMSIFEFIRGIRLFAPSCVLSDLRLLLVSCHGSVMNAFASLTHAMRSEPLQVEELQKVLKRLGVSEFVDVPMVFDIVEPRKDGGLSINELVTALESVACGTTKLLSPQLRDHQAHQEVRWQLAPFHKNASELRRQVRAPGRPAEEPRELPTGLVSCPETFEPAGPRCSMDRVLPPPSTPQGWSCVSQMIRDPDLRRSIGLIKNPLPPIKLAIGAASPQDVDVTRKRATVQHKDSEASYSKIETHVCATPAYSEDAPVLKNLHRYYMSVGDSMSSSEPYIVETQSGFKQWRRSLRLRESGASPRAMSEPGPRR